MEMTQILLVLLLSGFFLSALICIFRRPLKLICKLLCNTALGFLALFLLGTAAPFTGIHLGLNLWNALVIGVLGLPGFGLLLLTQWVL